MNKPKAVVTVTFPHPVTGAELMGAVKSAIESKDNNYRQFRNEQRYDNGDVSFIIGHASGYPYEHIVIAPTQELLEIRPDETYESVVVMSHSWPVSTYLVGYGDDAPINVVRKFAEMLQLHFSESPVTSSSPWPQEIKVCAICETIIRSNFEGTHCPNDGHNPPTKTVKVTPVPA